MSSPVESWKDWMLAAHYYLGIAPQAFWQMTPLELKYLLKPMGVILTDTQISKLELSEMQKQFPDQNIV